MATLCIIHSSVHHKKNQGTYQTSTLKKDRLLLIVFSAQATQLASDYIWLAFSIFHCIT